MTTLNEQFYAEGWGWLIKGALGIEPEDAEAQARKVAKYAVEVFKDFDGKLDDLQERTDNRERELEYEIETLRDELAMVKDEKEEADARADELTDRVQDLKNQLRDAEGRIFDLESGNVP